jgi:hypothetical protein
MIIEEMENVIRDQINSSAYMKRSIIFSHELQVHLHQMFEIRMSTQKKKQFHVDGSRGAGSIFNLLL